MIVCSCAVISDRDIELALIEILNQRDPPVPTPGVVYRQLAKQMVCCGCAPLAVETIYRRMEELERRGVISPYLGSISEDEPATASATPPEAPPATSDRRMRCIAGTDVLELETA